MLSEASTDTAQQPVHDASQFPIAVQATRDNDLGTLRQLSFDHPSGFVAAARHDGESCLEAACANKNLQIIYPSYLKRDGQCSYYVLSSEEVLSSQTKVLLEIVGYILIVTNVMHLGSWI